MANLVGNVLVIPAYSFMGSAVVTLACQGILLLLTVRASAPLGHAPLFDTTFARFFAFAGLSSAVAWFAVDSSGLSSPFLRLCLVSAVFSVFYLLPNVRKLKASKPVEA